MTTRVRYLVSAAALATTFTTVVAPLNAGTISIWAYMDINLATHPEKDWVIAGHRATYNNFAGKDYYQYNFSADENNYCFDATDGWDSGFINHNASQFGAITSNSFVKRADKSNGSDASALCWSCLGDRDPNEYVATGFAHVFRGTKLIASLSKSYARDSGSLCLWSIEPPQSPIILDMGGDNIRLSGPSVEFDIDADGDLELVSWVKKADDVFLAFDRNGNGTVDNGAELLGDSTPLLNGATAEHGFQVLAELDLPENGGNGDGYFTEEDSTFGELLLWSDSNRDGFGGSGELQPASSAGLVSIDLDYVESRRRDRHGNEFRYNTKAAIIIDGKTGIRHASDVFLVTIE